ncbi:hypothetical protein [Alkalihalobacillus sp. AL-G]|uniref:hypothetical protein n=1 Tax=Alkalihalobacillus sp. AL-G TaxID=2926399 RepID=UPI00272D12C3|nr:hypothetical protein [Alkalihalobacillus sp. AL-G]WLD92419.1 hypothetical protein MOJ78_15550 [Alkalihalobacillus sp. AL-G]
MILLKKAASKTAEISVLTVFSGIFAGYALVVYPIERIALKQSKRTQKTKIKYASQF